MRPLVYIHEGNQPYLKTAISCAKNWNNDVVLIGDKSNKAYCDKWVDMDTLDMSEYVQFSQLYKHMSKNPYWFELVCFKRYFALYEYAENSKLDEFILCDSDLLVYGDLSKFNYGQYEAAFSYCEDQSNYRWSASPHCSFWKTESLRKFIDYVIFTYRDNLATLQQKWEYHVQNNVGGGICDMTLLYLWKESTDILIMNTAIEQKNGMVFDHMLAKGECYKVDEYLWNKYSGIKKIVFEDGMPYFIRTSDHQKVRALTLHAQGGSKKYIPCLFHQRNNRLFYELRILKYYLETPIRRYKRRKKEKE